MRTTHFSVEKPGIGGLVSHGGCDGSEHPREHREDAVWGHRAERTARRVTQRVPETHHEAEDSHKPPHFAEHSPTAVTLLQATNQSLQREKPGMRNELISNL